MCSERETRAGSALGKSATIRSGPAPPPVYQGQYDPKALFAVLKVFAGIR